MLEGKKIILRDRDWEKDFEAHFRWRNDPEVFFWAEPWRRLNIVSREEMKELWRQAMRHQPEPSTEKLWEIGTKDGVHIGGIGFNANKANRKCEIGISIYEKSYWSKGYGTDALTTLLRYLFEEMKLHRVELNTWSGNKRAIRCYEKCGFRIEGVLREAVFCIRDGKYYDHLIFGILDREFAEM